MPALWTDDENAELKRLPATRDALNRRSPLLMFTLGVAATFIVTNGWQAFSGGGVTSIHRTEHADNLRTASAPPAIVLSGVNGEAFAEGDIQVASAKLARAFEPTSLASAEIKLPKKLQIGDILTLSSNSGAKFSFKVAKLAPLCSADPSHQPVPDVALVECAGRDLAEQWRYVIEAVAEPVRDDIRTGSPRSL